MQGTCRYPRTHELFTFHTAESPHAGYVSVPQDTRTVHISYSLKSTCRVRVGTPGQTNCSHFIQPKVHMQGTCRYSRTHELFTFHTAESPHAGYVSVPQDTPSVHISCSQKSTCRVRVETPGHTKCSHFIQPKVHVQGTCQHETFNNHSKKSHVLCIQHTEIKMQKCLPCNNMFHW